MVLSLNPASLNREAEAIVAKVKAEPLQAGHRVALANVRLLQGQFHKALQQMQVACQSNLEWAPQAQLVKMLVQSETVRQAVFAGSIQADLMAPAPVWLEAMMQALRSEPATQAAELRLQGLAQAPETAGVLNHNTAFEWFSDGDERLGPVLELYTASRYFWLPIEQIATVQLQPQGDVLDLLWLKASVVLGGATQKKLTGYVPARYPSNQGKQEQGSEGEGEFETEWTPGLTEDGWQGCGQRVWYMDGEAAPITEVSHLAFNPTN